MKKSSLTFVEKIFCYITGLAEGILALLLHIAFKDDGNKRHEEVAKYLMYGIYTWFIVVFFITVIAIINIVVK